MQIILKKGQLKIQQVAFMLIAVTIFFALVVLFYFAIKIANLESDYRIMQREKAEGLITKITHYPELSFRGISRAVDKDKLIILKEKQEYQDFFGKGVKGIIIQTIYPSGEIIECSRENYNECNLIKIFTQRSVSDVSSYVSLCYNVPNGYECEIALIMLDIDEEFEDE